MADAPQNIYDDPDFFAGYRALRTNDTGLNGALEAIAARPELESEVRRPPFLVLMAARPG